MSRRYPLAGAAAAACAATLGSGAAFAAPIRYSVSYTGSGTWRTVYRAAAPNPGGKPDHNRADDRSVQRWSLRFADMLELSDCGSACRSVLSRARGRETVAGLVAHVHRDGIYRRLDASVYCRISYTTPYRAALTPRIEAVTGAGALRLTALDPVTDALADLPGACPGQGDPIDGLANYYFVPGFSFAPGWGADRWLRSATATIPLTALGAHRTVRIALGPTARGFPPRDCAPTHPWERCRVTGRWRGVLTLRRAR